MVVFCAMGETFIWWPAKDVAEASFRQCWEYLPCTHAWPCVRERRLVKFKIVLLLLESLSHLPVFSLIMCEDSVITYTFYNTARNKVGKIYLLFIVIYYLLLFIARTQCPFDYWKHLDFLLQVCFPRAAWKLPPCQGPVSAQGCIVHHRVPRQLSTAPLLLTEQGHSLPGQRDGEGGAVLLWRLFIGNAEPASSETVSMPGCSTEFSRALSLGVCRLVESWWWSAGSSLRLWPCCGLRAVIWEFRP